jgi:Fur family ferric uptake transcriptional regulator
MRARLSRKEALQRLQATGLEPTEHRLRILMAVGSAPRPSSAPEILEHVKSDRDINRVTVYRILDLLVAHQVLNRLSLGEKSQRFCLRDVPGDAHPHFHCTRCDRFLCLDAQSLALDHQALAGLALDIRHVDIRLEGICPSCRETSG